MRARLSHQHVVVVLLLAVFLYFQVVGLDGILYLPVADSGLVLDHRSVVDVWYLARVVERRLLRHDNLLLLRVDFDRDWVLRCLLDECVLEILELTRGQLLICDGILIILLVVNVLALGE